MFDQSTLKGRIIASAMTLAAEKPWKDITLLDIAEATGVRLVDVKGVFASKAEIVTAFAREVDDEVLRRAPAKPQAAGGHRDALFEIVMTRFDVLAPYKKALRSIIKTPSLDVGLVRGFFDSQRWMLEAAGVSTDGISGAVRVKGLAAVYGSVFRTWLDDDDPGHARTMAALDRRLRRAESTYSNLHEARRAVERFAGLFSGRRRPAEPDPSATAGEGI